MEKVNHTGRENFRSTVNESIQVEYVRTTTEDNVFVSGSIKKEEDNLGNLSFNAKSNQLTLLVKNLSSLSSQERTALLSTLAQDLNDLID